MRTLHRSEVGALFLLLLASAAAGAQDTAGRSDAREAREAREAGRDGLFTRLTYLVPPSAAKQLNLSEEQRKQVETLEGEFKQKRRTTLMKAALTVNTILDDKRGEREKEAAPVLAIAHEVTGTLLELRRTRVTYEKKLLGVLDSAQREAFLSLKETGNRRDNDRDRGRDSRFQAVSFSRERVDRLDLSAEQRKKVEALETEYRDRLRELLTAEQRRRLDGDGAAEPARDRRPDRKSPRKDGSP